jgi:hypothetical protein
VSEAEAQRAAMAEEIGWALSQAAEAAEIAAGDPALRAMVLRRLREAEAAIAAALAAEAAGVLPAAR